ncbi:hypothetical protein E4U43_001718 [Claviceps pusilla]|uniref:WLM domain-containing protein n=1 Tax=Claviceps pusilla TaxID=123648 RepID=A0A9P7SZ06_9HYPO|nr:hypothetical protein E4U43_001718 [Claviceps pusilla]
MPEYESLVGAYVHLAREARAAEALVTLKKVASLVKPIMRARGWKVGQLAEFYPEQANLLGLNVNRGMKICLRLRYPGDRNQFLPTENVVDTMLHELAHIVHGPHNQQFHALWDQLRDECQGLIMKGYTGEGFLGQGHRLGGARMPDREIRRVAREAAEKRRGQSALAMGSGQRLGGTAPRPGQDIRHTIATAVERRNAVLRGCGSGRYNDQEMHEIADTASKNGFRTQAEEDEANEAAIAQALWELVQEDEKNKLGKSYVRPSAENPQGRSGGSVTSGQFATASSKRASGSDRPTGAATVAAEGSSKAGQESGIWNAFQEIQASGSISTVCEAVEQTRGEIRYDDEDDDDNNRLDLRKPTQKEEGGYDEEGRQSKKPTPFDFDKFNVCTTGVALQLLRHSHGATVVDLLDVWENEGRFQVGEARLIRSIVYVILPMQNRHF